ncbi:hypothetical protein GDO81_015184 [Engystomops pustulosus]|uniref:Uncharacterized protein n=1 Tax=Engystomops pustulosus TaxID=76066 RepID=A0AAV7AHC4_ENGPU|nr:hypothetical protein GDO81_015184 [Engystomops pustulosus]
MGTNKRHYIRVNEPKVKNRLPLWLLDLDEFFFLCFLLNFCVAVIPVFDVYLFSLFVLHPGLFDVFLRINFLLGVMSHLVYQLLCLTCEGMICHLI